MKRADSDSFDIKFNNGGKLRNHNEISVLGGNPGATKGQIKSECKYEVKIFPNYERNIFMNFCPASLYRLGTYVVIFFKSTQLDQVCA